jgi:hypothetical protein
MATAPGVPADLGTTPPRATTARLAPVTSTSAREIKRRRQSRTVVWGRPTRWATVLVPRPASPTIASSAAPITPTASSRPWVIKLGSTAWLVAQGRHRCRRTASLCDFTALRSRSDQPQKLIGLAQAGHLKRGISRARPSAT